MDVPVVVHPRVSVRHPEITDEDAIHAWVYAGECDGSWKVLPGRPQLFGEDTMPVGTRLPQSLVRELDEAAGELGQTRSELVRRFISDGLLALKA